MVVSRILQKQGVDLTVTTNGIEALSCLENCGFDLLLTDVFMPEMGGKELVEVLRGGKTINTKIPVIALTAMGDIHEAEQLKAHGMDRVILKPFNSKELIRAIGEECSSSHEDSANNDSKLIDEGLEDMQLSGGLIDGLDAEIVRKRGVNEFSLL